MAVSWPTTLPLPLADGYGEKIGDGRLVTKMEQGPRRIRNRFVNTPNEMSLTFLMTAAQVVEFENFWSTSLSHGVLPISIELFSDGVLESKDVQILSVGRRTPLSPDLFRMSMQVETV